MAQAPSETPSTDSSRDGNRARHCTELLGAPPSIDELVPALSFLGEKLVRLLPDPLARICGGDPPTVRTTMPMDTTLAGIQSELETLASHTLLAIGSKSLPALATIEAPPILRLVDRAFGGNGTVPDPLPERLPVSAELLLRHIENAIASVLAQLFEQGTPCPVRPVRRDTSLRQLAPFDMRADVLQLSLEIEQEGSEPWSFALAFPITTLAAILTPRRAVRLPRARAGGRKTGAQHEPFASLLLEVTAVLVDMPMSMRRLSALRPGDVIPVPVSRAVPLLAGGHVIATGTVGELDDKVAVQVGQAF